MDARSQVIGLCQEVESELREISNECRKKFPSIKDSVERAMAKVRQCRDAAVADRSEEVPIEFPLEEVLKALIQACETFQTKVVLLSIACLQRLIHRHALRDEGVGRVINLLKEQASSGDEPVQLKVLQTIMATPVHMTLLNEVVVEQLVQLLYVLHNSTSVSVHHTACACFRQLAENLADVAAASLAAEAAHANGDAPPAADLFRSVSPVIQRNPASIPTVTPGQSPATLTGALRMYFLFVQDLCVMADYDASSLSSRYAVDAGERMRTGSREGYWISTVKFPRPLCLELLGTCMAARPEVFARSIECFALLRHNLCAVLLKSLRGCFDFAILIRSIHLLQQILKCPNLAVLITPELQVFMLIMLDLTNAERSPWQRATSLEFLKSVCEEPTALSALYDHSPAVTTPNGAAETGTKTFLELVNSLSKLMHQVCFSSGMDSGALLQCAAVAGNGLSSASASSGQQQRTLQLDVSVPLLDGCSLPLKGGVNSPGKAFCYSSSLSETSAGARRLSETMAQAPLARASSMGAGRLGPGRVRLLVMMSDAEPPSIQPSFLVLLVVECVFAIVSTLFRSLVEADEGEETSDGSPARSRSGSLGARASVVLDELAMASRRPISACTVHIYLPVEGSLSPAQERCRGMLSDCWASLLSALSLLLHGTGDEAFLQQTLRCLQTLLYCCSRLGLDQARDNCLLQLARYALPGQSHESDVADLGSTGSVPPGALTQKNALCFRALLSFCSSFGALLGTAGWTIALRAVCGLERVLHKALLGHASEHAMALKSAVETLFEHSALLPETSLQEVVSAMALQLQSAQDTDDGIYVFNRLSDLCSYNLQRLRPVWSRILDIVQETSAPEQGHSGELRGTAAACVCRILAQALRQGVVPAGECAASSQEELLLPLEPLLRVPHEDTRARVCEGLMAILQASGQELQPAAWSAMIRLVAAAARFELGRAGLEFYLPTALDAFSPAVASLDTSGGIPSRGDGGGGEGAGREGREAPPSTVLPTIFQLLELLVHDFMDYVPVSSVPLLTASIGAFGRFSGLGVNSSLTAVGFLWNVADALARYPAMPAPEASSCKGLDATVAVTSAGPAAAASGDVEELWIQIFMHLRVLAIDPRPEVRNCAVKSLTSALLSHGRKVGSQCYQRCLRDILVKVLAEIESATRRARSGGAGEPKASSENLIVHHSRNTLEKQWSETMVLGMDGVRRVLAHYAEDAGVNAFAPLAYTLLLQVQATLQALSPEVSGSALRGLVELMRIPTSNLPFDVGVLAGGDPALPVPTEGSTSVWILGWSVLWGMTQFCRTREVPEKLVEIFASTLCSLRSSHQHLMSLSQHLVLQQLALGFVTAPPFYLPVAQPLQQPAPAAGNSGAIPRTEAADALAGAAGACAAAAGRRRRAAGAGAACANEAEEREVFEVTARSPEVLWNLRRRFDGAAEPPGYSKAAAAVTSVVDENKSRSLEVRSIEAVLRDVQVEGAGDEAQLAVQGKVPTFRTMLHISSARLHHVQAAVFAMLEDTPGSADPLLVDVFLFQCCATFLDARTLLRDTNKLALGARTLCLLVLFCRRVVLHGLAASDSGVAVASGAATSTFAAAKAAKAIVEVLTPEAHLGALVAAMPRLLRAVVAVACGGSPIGASAGPPSVAAALQATGLWKLAVETLVYLVEDTLPALERKAVVPSVATACWEAIMGSLEAVVARALPLQHLAPVQAPIASTSSSSSPGGPGPPGIEPAPAGDLLTQAVANLIVHKLLSSPATPREARGRLVPLLGELVGLGGGAPGGETTPRAAALGHLFDLCSMEEAVDCTTSLCEESAAALAARGAGARLRPPARLPDRAAVLRMAVPLLLSQVRSVLAAHVEEAARLEAQAAAAAPEESLAASDAPAPYQASDEVRSVLNRLKALRVDDAALAAAALALPSERARSACKLAGPRGIVVALLPQLAALAAASDRRVARDVREVLEGLASELGL